MICLMLMGENDKEMQILTMAFDQLGVKVIISNPSYANYIKAQQYCPDVFIIEMPRINAEQQHFTSLIRKHKKTRNAPIVAFGGLMDQALVRGMMQNGVSEYMPRPLKFSALVKLIERFLTPFKKSLYPIQQEEGVDQKSEDIKLILDPGTLPMQKIQLMVKHIGNLMAFPFTVTKVLRLAESSKSGAQDLARVIEADPVIATTILKISNTVFFASVGRRITSIKDAIIRIGFRETKHVVMSMLVMDIFDEKNKSLGFSRVEFWHHSIATAVIAEMLAKHVGDVSSEEAFLGGLLHDFGIILLDEFYPAIFAAILEDATNQGGRFVDAEIRLLNITHNDVLKELFTAWKLPPVITEAVCMHYAISSEEKTFATPEERLAACISMANMIAKSCDIGAGCDKFTHPLDPWIFRAVKMPSGVTTNFVDSINRELDLYRQFLSIESVATTGSPNGKSIGLLITGGQVFCAPENYLRAQGHTVTRIPSLEVIDKQAGKFDLIIVYSDIECPITVIDDLLALAAAAPEGEVGAPVPVLAPYAADWPIAADAPSRERLSLIPRAVDLRSYDEALSVILDEKKKFIRHDQQ